jgi:hypothetical protein
MERNPIDMESAQKLRRLGRYTGRVNELLVGGWSILKFWLMFVLGPFSNQRNDGMVYVPLGMEWEELRIGGAVLIFVPIHRSCQAE